MIKKRALSLFVIAESREISDLIIQLIDKDSNLDLSGISYDLSSAIQIIKRKTIDVLIVDPGSTNVKIESVIKKIAEECPLPIIFLTSTNDNILIKKLVPYDNVMKPRIGDNLQGFIQELQVKIKIISTEKISKDSFSVPQNNFSNKQGKIIAIGASTGGVEALAHILVQLPSEMPGIVIVQHMPARFSKLFADRLNGSCKLRVKEAADGDEVRQGVAIIAAGEKHLKIVKTGDKYIVRSYVGEKVSGHCPSVDVLFESVAQNVGSNAIGVILTGMGADGAVGLLAMKKTGAYTIGQDKASCVVYGMPMEAFTIGAVSKQIPLENIAKELINLTR